MPAHRALSGPRRVRAARDGDLWMVFAERRSEVGERVLEPLEAAWALASPFVGVRDARGARAACDWLLAQPWQFAVVAGLLRGQEPLAFVARELAARVELRLGPSTPRYVADLSAGVDSYLSRRSRNFRRSLARARRRAKEVGLVIEAAHAATEAEAEVVHQRLLAIEGESWKDGAGVGLHHSSMAEFYRQMGQRMARGGRHRCWFATQDGADLGYVLGGVRAARYRGLQFSFRDTARELSIGNLLQLEQMHALVGEGVREYDLGSEAHYKERWADRVDESPVLVAVRR